MNYLVSKRIPNAEAFLVHCERLSMKSKSLVFRQGEPSEDLYLILDGSVSMIVDDIEDPEQEMVVSYLNPGEFFDEMGYLAKSTVRLTLSPAHRASLVASVIKTSTRFVSSSRTYCMR
jgi:CRP-like cAMP-binding protein